MSDRVLSTAEAQQAVQHMQRIINGGLVEQIASLDAQAQILSNPNVWDGRLASQFRGQQWPDLHRALTQTKEALTQLQANIQQINQNIMAAGGN